jgi:hypothetical protein
MDACSKCHNGVSGKHFPYCMDFPYSPIQSVEDASERILNFIRRYGCDCGICKHCEKSIETKLALYYLVSNNISKDNTTNA